MRHYEHNAKYSKTNVQIFRFIKHIQTPETIIESHFRKKNSAKLQLWCDVLACISWTRKSNTAAMNGMFYGLASESDCKTFCLSSPSCVAIDIGPAGCVVHFNVSDLATVYYSAAVTHFILSRICQPTSPATTESTLTSTTFVPVTPGML